MARTGRDRPDELAAAIELVAVDPVGALERAPAEVLRRLVELEQHAVDLLDLVLADVADPDLAERGVEPEAPRVAQAGEHDVPPRQLRASTSAAISLPSRLLRVLGGPARVERAAAVAEARGRAARRGRTRAGRRCGSPPAGRRSSSCAHGPRRRSCAVLRARGTRRRGCRRCGPTSAGTGAGWWRSRGGRRCRAGPARRRCRTWLGEVEQRRPLPAVDPHDAAGLLEHPQRVGVARRGADPDRAVEPAGDPLDVEVVRAALLRRGLGAAHARRAVVAAAGERRGRERQRDEEGAEHGRAC